MEWRCFTRLSKYGISSDLGQSSVKFMSAAAAWAWTRWLPWSSMVCRRAPITWKTNISFQKTSFWRDHNFTTFFPSDYSTTCLLMKFLLKPRCKVSCHLSNSVTSGVSYSRMLKKYFPQIVNKQLWEQKSKHFEIITRTILTGSWRNSKTKLTISFKIPSICWWQPSPMAESAIKPACLYFQSATEE